MTDELDESSESIESVKDCWTLWFCSQAGNDFYCEVDASYLKDRFNYYGLENVTNYFVTINNLDYDEDSTIFDESYPSSMTLYGRIHARYILTEQGAYKMAKKYIRSDFGKCPRVNCNNQRMLPVGLTDEPCKQSVKLFCPRCLDVYRPKNVHSDVDGANFGTSFPHMLFMVFPKLRVKPSLLKLFSLNAPPPNENQQ